MQINRHKCNEIASYFRIFMLNLQANLIFISGFSVLWEPNLDLFIKCNLNASKFVGFTFFP